MSRYTFPLLGLTLLLTGCLRQGLFVVLPNADGRPGSGSIHISDGKTTTVLNKPYASAEARENRTAPVKEPPAVTRVIFNQAISARPILPHHFRLYFRLGSNKLTADSVKAYHAVFDDIHSRRAYEIEVIGHTDTLGTQTYNQKLSLARAKAIRDKLVADGIAGNAISVAGRGELDPIVPTGDQVAEPKNRYVEILVR